MVAYVVDVLTKGFLIQNFDIFVRKLGLIDIYISTQGGVLELVGLAQGRIYPNILSFF